LGFVSHSVLGWERFRELVLEFGGSQVLPVI
jgi:hypothetical protein